MNPKVMMWARISPRNAARTDAAARKRRAGKGSRDRDGAQPDAEHHPPGDIAGGPAEGLNQRSC